MDDFQSNWLIIIVAMAAGALIGILIYRQFAPSLKQADKVKTELDEAREELTTYKTSVNQHFEKTSELVNELTQSYVRVYQHLADGSQALADNKAFTNLLEQHRGTSAITVDDDAIAADKVADNFTDKSTAESEDTPSEPSVNASIGETVPDNREDDTAGVIVSDSNGKSGSAVEDPQSDPDAGGIEETTDNAGGESHVDAGSTEPEIEKKSDYRT